MVDDLLRTSQAQYGHAKQYYLSGDMERALVDYHDALEHLLRWCMIRDGAPPARATNPDEVTWQTLITYLDARYGIERQACVFLGQMTHLRDRMLAGEHPELKPLAMQGYEKLVTQLFRRLFPRTEDERRLVDEKAVFARPRPVDDLTTMPPERARDTHVIVPTPPPTAPTSGADHPAPGTTTVPEALSEEQSPNPISDRPPRAVTPPPYTASPDTDAGRRERAIEAGKRLRELRLRGLEYCPNCRNEVAMTAETCAHCGFNLQAHRAPSRPSAAPSKGLLDRLLGLLRG